MNTLKLVLEERDDKNVPSSLLAFAPDEEQFREAYHSVGHVTNVIRDCILDRINKELFPSPTDLKSPTLQDDLVKRMIRVRALKEVLDILP